MGQYDPVRARANVHGAKNKFDSTTLRGYVTRRLERQGEIEPCPGTYSPKMGFEDKAREIDHMTH